MWRRGGTVLLLIVAGVAALVHKAGGGTAIIIIVAAAALFAGFLVLRYLPHIRQHFNANRRKPGMRRTRTTRTITRGQRGRLGGAMRGRLGSGRGGAGLGGRKGRLSAAAGGRKGAGTAAAGRKGLARLNPFSGRKGSAAAGAGARRGRHSVPGGAGARGKRTMRHPLGGGRRSRAGTAGTGRRATGQAGRRRSGTGAGAKTGRRSVFGRRGTSAPGFPGGRPGMRHPGQRRQYRRSQKAQGRAARTARRAAAAAAPGALGGAPRLRRTRAAGRFLRHPTAAGRQRAQAARLARHNRKAGKGGGRQGRRDYRHASRQRRKDARVAAAQGRKTANNARRAAAGGRWRHARKWRTITCIKTRDSYAWTRRKSRAQTSRLRARRVARLAKRYPGGVPPLARRIAGRWSGRTPLRARMRAWGGRTGTAAATGAGLAGFLLFWRKRSRARQAPPTYWTRPPERPVTTRADPEDGRMPEPAGTVPGSIPLAGRRRPGTAAAFSGGGAGMAGVIHSAAEQFSSVVATHQPTTTREMRDIFDGMPESMTEVAAAFSGLKDSADGLPIGPGTKQAMEQFTGLFTSAVQQAEEIRAMFNSEHAEEIERIENPRPSEDLWDTVSDQ
jgi:hypothetical protein